MKERDFNEWLLYKPARRKDVVERYLPNKR